MISACSQGMSFNITVIQVYAPTTDAKEAEIDQFCEDLEDLLELTPKKKRYSIYHWKLEWKSRKSKDTWSNRQVWPWRTEWSRAKANWILPREYTGHSKHPFSTTQEMTLHMDISKWSILKSYWYILCNQGWRSYKQSAKTRTGADCSSDHQLLIQNSGLN